MTSTTGTKKWTDLPQDAQDKFTAWMDTNPTGRAVATEADGDRDYAVWLIAVELICHELVRKPYTTFSDMDWRGSYDAGDLPEEAVRVAVVGLIDLNSATLPAPYGPGENSSPEVRR